MNLRSVLTLGSLSAALLACDLTQRVLIAPMARLLPGSRDALLTEWQRFTAHLTIFFVRHMGGARFGELPTIPATAGVLVLMNHQSLMDIPLVVASMRGVYPRILTRRRYGRGVPLISHMTRLYGYPFVDPRATLRGELRRLREEAAASPHPLVVYPEGTRTKTGRIGPFKTLGLATLLAARRWDVYVVVADGLWKSARFKDLVRNLSSIHTRVECRGPFDSPPPDADLVPFIMEMREVMKGMLLEMRDEPFELRDEPSPEARA